MNAPECEHTEKLMLRLNEQNLQPGDAEHLNSCPVCREALAIRKALLKNSPPAVPDRSALLWQQHTIHKLLKREKKQSGLTMRLSVILDIAVAALLTAAIFIFYDNEPAQLPLPGVERPFENLLLQPFVWGALLITGIIVYIALRLRNSKN